MANNMGFKHTLCLLALTSTPDGLVAEERSAGERGDSVGTVDAASRADDSLVARTFHP